MDQSASASVLSILLAVAAIWLGREVELWLGRSVDTSTRVVSYAVAAIAMSIVSGDPLWASDFTSFVAGMVWLAAVMATAQAFYSWAVEFDRDAKKRSYKPPD